MVSHMHLANGKGYLNGHPMVPTFLQRHLPLSKRFDPSEKWLSLRCLTSLITQELVSPSWYKLLLTLRWLGEKQLRPKKKKENIPRVGQYFKPGSQGPSFSFLSLLLLLLFKPFFCQASPVHRSKKSKLGFFLPSFFSPFLPNPS